MDERATFLVPDRGLDSRSYPLVVEVLDSVPSRVWPLFQMVVDDVGWKAWASGKVDLRDPLDGDGQPLRTASERDQAATRVCAIRPASRTGLGRLPAQPRACL